MNPNLGAAEPIPQNLLRQIISEASNEHWDDLWVRILDQFANARLRPQKLIGIVVEIARAFGMKPDDISCAFATELG